MKKKYHLYISVILTLTIGILTYFNLLYSVDSYLTDSLYNRKLKTTDEIIIIGVDDKTLETYGNFSLWGREKCAKLLEILYGDEDNAPSVVGIDFLFVDENEESLDDALVNSSRLSDNLVFASNLVYRGALKVDEDNSLYYDDTNIDRIERPYNELNTNVKNGFTNTIIGKDGFVRYSMFESEFEGEKLNSFAYEIYSLYMENKGIEPYVPDTNEFGQFQFFFSGKTEEFSHVSLVSVINGEVPASAFKDKIVLVGAYAPGFMDAYQVGVDRGDPVYGVEINANMIQSFMEEKTATDANKLFVLIVTGCIIFGFVYFSENKKLVYMLIASAVTMFLYLVLGCVLADKKQVIPIVYLLLGLVLADIYLIVDKYLLERIRRRKTLSVFKKYVAPQVVDRLSVGDDFEIRLGGEKRNIAVLFVDIRGFTPLSESLDPEQVVAILNQYLTHTTQCIFKHGGTLDKFIGDAAMAVFNAPFDQDDYIYEAVCAAYDIAQGAEVLGQKLLKEYGKNIGFGVGVNCGEAVVGNIGSDFRMDYTAIGDTVNTAARLEANAAAGQVLISENVFEKLSGRIEAESIGQIPLKGKSNKIEVYSVTTINKED